MLRSDLIFNFIIVSLMDKDYYHSRLDKAKVLLQDN